MSKKVRLLAAVFLICSFLLAGCGITDPDCGCMENDTEPISLIRNEVLL